MEARKFTEKERKIILDTYVNEGKSLKACGRLVNASDKLIRKFLVSQGVEIRKYAKNRAAIDREKIKNKNYFAYENHNMAWLLGFLASDGTISSKKNSIKIGLSRKDEEVLEKIREELELTDSHITQYETSTGYDVSELSWTCAKHKQDLAKYNIVPNKTFILQPPILLDRRYWIDYIRGYFDGDGSISFNHSNKSICFSIGSATKDIISFIIDCLYEDYKIPKVNIQKDTRRNHIYYYCQYSTNASKLIYQILYTPNALYLKRKKDKYEKILTLK